MTTLKPFDNLLAIEVPIDAVNINLHYWNKLWHLQYSSSSIYPDIITISKRETLNNKKYFLLGTVTPTEVDFDCSSIFIVSTSAVTKKDYKIYLNEQSLRSLLSYNGIEIKEEYKLIILEKQ